MMSIVRAGLFSTISWLKNNRAAMLALIVWPYLMAFTILFLGNVFGNPTIFASRMGVSNPTLYVLTGGSVAVACLAIVDSVATSILFHRWLGTLPYILLAPYNTMAVLLLEPLPTALVTSTIPLLAVIPVAVAVEGLCGFAKVLLALALVYLAMLPLVGFSLIIAAVSLATKQEHHVFGFVTPFLLMVSGVFYPIDILPEILQLVSFLAPPRYVVEAMRILSMFREPSIVPLARCILALAALSLLYNFASIPGVAAMERLIKRSGAI